MPDRDDPMLRLQYYRETGQNDEAKNYEHYLRETGQYRNVAPRAAMSVPKVGADATSALPRNRVDASGDFETIGKAAAANLANVAQGVPGMRLAEAGARSLVRGQPYREALSDIDAATNSIPTPVRIAGRLVGGAPLAGLLPAGTVAQAAKSGAALGAADQALDANPDLSIADRAKNTAKGAVIGGAAGAAAAGTVKAVDRGREFVGLAKRVGAAKPLDETAISMKKATEDADAVNFGRVDAEAAAAGGTSPGLRDALDHPTIKPFADAFRSSAKGRGADDAETTQSVLRMMSKKRRSLNAKNKKEYDEVIDTQIADLSDAIDRLTHASASPSTKPAITLDVAPETYTVNPKVTAGREAMSGPVGTGPLSERTSAPNPSLSQALRNFRGNTPNAVQGPDGPAFQLRGQPDRVTPGVSIETPGMRIETAPAQEVPAPMPSLPGARAEHARMKGNRQTFGKAAERTNRIMRGTRTPDGKLDTESPAAWMDDILGMNPEQAQHALTGTLGEAKGQAGYKLPRDASIVGAIKELGGPAQRLHRIAPYVRALDKQAGNTPFTPIDLEQYLQFLGALNAPLANK